MAIENKIPVEAIQKYVDEPFEVVKYLIKSEDKDAQQIIEIQKKLSLAETSAFLAELINFCFEDDIYHPELYYSGMVVLYAKYATNLPMITIDGDNDTIDIEKTYHYLQTLRICKILDEESDEWTETDLYADDAIEAILWSSSAMNLYCEQAVDHLARSIQQHHNQVYFDAINEMSDMMRLFKTGIAYVTEELKELFQSDDVQQTLIGILEQVPNMQIKSPDGKIIKMPNIEEQTEKGES